MTSVRWPSSVSCRVAHNPVASIDQRRMAVLCPGFRIPDGVKNDHIALWPPAVEAEPDGPRPELLDLEKAADVDFRRSADINRFCVLHDDSSRPTGHFPEWVPAPHLGFFSGRPCHHNVTFRSRVNRNLLWITLNARAQPTTTRGFYLGSSSGGPFGEPGVRRCAGEPALIRCGESGPAVRTGFQRAAASFLGRQRLTFPETPPPGARAWVRGGRDPRANQTPILLADMSPHTSADRRRLVPAPSPDRAAAVFLFTVLPRRAFAASSLRNLAAGRFYAKRAPPAASFRFSLGASH